MIKLRSRRGAGLVEVMITVMLLAAAGLTFSAIFPTAFSASRQADEYKTAAAIGQRKMEQLRAMNYQSLTQPILRSAEAIDASPTSSPYSFTSVEAVGTHLASGTGTLEVDDISSDVKRVRITITWQGPDRDTPRSVQLTTLFADRRTRGVN